MLMSLNRRKQNQRGIGLLELMLSISIIAILLVMATRYYMSAKQSEQISDAVSMVSGIISGGANYATGNNTNPNTYTGMSLLTLVQGGYVPPSLCGGASCPGLNPWRGTIVVDGSAGTNYTITMASIPTNVCPNVMGMVNASISNTQIGATNNSYAQCSGGTLTVTIY